MITQQEIDNILSTTPQEIYREVSSSLIGARSQMSASETAKFYGLYHETVLYYWEKYGLISDAKTSIGKKTKKTSVIEQYIKQNYGRIITPHDLVSATGISMPTFYNFFNANRGYFKKIKRGQFEIVNPDKERELSK